MSNSKKQSQLMSYFPRVNLSSASSKEARIPNELAVRLGTKLGSDPIYLTDDCKSWYILAKGWLPPKSKEDFDAEWMLHPVNRRQVVIYGKPLNERRWSQAWGVSMAYSGLEQTARDIEGSTVLPHLLNTINRLSKDASIGSDNLIDSNSGDIDQKLMYNACLQNWYLPEDSMGLHSDDESYLIHEMPIFSLSWGGTRRFVFRRKGGRTPGKHEIWLENGDLLVMGGSCQETHKHEVPKIRITKDPPTSNRINWTIRAVKK